MIAVMKHMAEEQADDRDHSHIHATLAMITWLESTLKMQLSLSYSVTVVLWLFEIHILFTQPVTDKAVHDIFTPKYMRGTQ